MTKSRRYYISVEVDFFDHPKTIAVGEKLAFRHLKAMAWCHRHTTDGFIPREAVASVVLSGAMAERLERAGFWDKVDGGWRIHDYLDHQESKESLDAAAERGRVGAEARHKSHATR